MSPEFYVCYALWVVLFAYFLVYDVGVYYGYLQEVTDILGPGSQTIVILGQGFQMKHPKISKNFLLLKIMLKNDTLQATSW
jgi:hypothetical protein